MLVGLCLLLSGCPKKEFSQKAPAEMVPAEPAKVEEPFSEDVVRTPQELSNQVQVLQEEEILPDSPSNEQIVQQTVLAEKGADLIEDTAVKAAQTREALHQYRLMRLERHAQKHGWVLGVVPVEVHKQDLEWWKEWNGLKAEAEERMGLDVGPPLMYVHENPTPRLLEAVVPASPPKE